MNTYNLFEPEASPESKSLETIYQELLSGLPRSGYYRQLSPEQKEYVDARAAINILKGHVAFYEKHPPKYWTEEGKSKCLERIAMHEETVKRLLANELQHP